MEEEGLAAAAGRISLAGGEDAAESRGKGDGERSKCSRGPQAESGGSAGQAASAGGGEQGRQGASGKGTEGRPPSEAQKQSANRLSMSDFVLGDELGQGSYSSVRRATNKASGHVVAIKIVEKALVIKEKKTQYMVMERDCLTLCRHPGIVKLTATFQDANRLYFVMEACPKDLFHHLKVHKTFSLACTRFYTAELVDILEYLHSKNIIHRDLKPENMLVTEAGHIKLTDFGTARIIKTGEEGKRTKSFVGTAEYVSPEVLENHGACQSSDLWALGCCLFQFLSGRVPFRGGSEYLTFQSIIAMEYTFPHDFPADAADLVRKLLVSDPEARLGASEGGMVRNYAAVRKHVFFSETTWADPSLFMQAPPAFAPFSAQV